MTTPTRRALPEGEAWRKYDEIESRLTAPVSERMLDLAQLRPGMHVVDLATGRGEPAIRAAGRVAPTGSVLGLDISEPMLVMARERAHREGVANIELRAADTQSLDDIAPATFDAATSRWALMYMPSPVRALTTARRILKPDALFVAAFWAEPERVPWAMLPRRVLARFRSVPAILPEAPGAFRYADPARIARDFEESGLEIVHTEDIDAPVIEASTGAGIVAWVRDLGLSRLAGDLEGAEHAAWEAALAQEAELLRDEGMIRLGGTTRLVVARSKR